MNETKTVMTIAETPVIPLTPVLAFALETMRPGDTRELPALPYPRRCCYGGFRCGNKLKYRVDGCFMCQTHFDDFWDRGNFVENHRVARL